MLRFAIVGALLVAGAVGAMNLPRGGELVPAETEETTLAANNMDQPYIASSANEFVDPQADTPAATTTAPSQQSAPQAESEALPAPSTITTEPSEIAPLPPS